jgi:hypothetical protein
VAVYWVNTTINIGKDNPKPWAFAFEVLGCRTLDDAHKSLLQDRCLKGNKIDVRDDGNGRRIVTSRREVLLGIHGIVSLQDYGFELSG